MNLKNKIILGTAQFLNNYGSTNNSFLSKKECFKILDLALKNNITNFDTAMDYNSEKILGEFIKINKLEKKVRIHTKIGNLRLIKNKAKIENLIQISLNKLRAKIFTLFIHNVNDFEFFFKNKDFFNYMKKKYSIKNFGFSIYKFSEYKKITKKVKNCTYQVPANIASTDFNNIKKSKNDKFFYRSIFMQGLLLKTNKKKIPLKLKKILSKYFDILNSRDIKPIDLCMNYIKQINNMDNILVGVNSSMELKEILNYKNIKIDEKLIIQLENSFKKVKKYTDPRIW